MRLHERGFALPLAAAAIALLALALGVAADALGAGAAGVRRNDARWRMEIAATTLEARLAHLLITSEVGPRALETRGGPLVLDGRAYRVRLEGVGLASVAMQDEAGLFNVNTLDEGAIARLLRGAGVQPWRAERLAGALADFTDADDLRRAHGAEAREYDSSGRSAPANALLDQAGGAWRALGWDELAPRQARSLLPLTAASDPAQPFNPNTAPPDVLAAVFALDARGVASLLALREQRTIVSFADAAEASGAAAAQGVFVLAQPARDIRVVVARPVGSLEESSVYVLQMHVAEAGSGAPIVVRWSSASARDWGRRLGDGRLDWLPDSPALLVARER